MYRRISLFRKNYHLLIAILLVSVVCMTFFSARIYYLIYQYNLQAVWIRVIPVLGLLIWYGILFYLFKSYYDRIFSGFVNRLNREIQEVVTGERRRINFRKENPWNVDELRFFLSDSLEQIRELERIYLIQKDTIRSALELHKENELKAISNEFKDFFITLDTKP